MLEDIICKVTKVGIKIVSITFDGYATNAPMCNLMGASLKIDPKTFRPFFFNSLNGEKNYIFMDPCHMLKLLRNLLGKLKVIHLQNGEKIEWRYIVSLYEYSKEFALNTHRLSRKHINWERSCMNVRLATQTFSDSVADSIQFLMDNKHPDFVGAGPTIKFIRIINKIFDIFNAKGTKAENIFKRAVNPENKRN